MIMKFKANDILSNKGNSLYQQILKSIIYLYVVNGERVRITKIRIELSTTRVHEVESIALSNEQQMSLKKQVANILYSTRNSIVHAKSNYEPNG